MDMGKVGSRKMVSIPLGDVVIRGKIDFSSALPRPVIEERPSNSQRQKSGVSCDKVLGFIYAIVILRLQI